LSRKTLTAHIIIQRKNWAKILRHILRVKHIKNKDKNLNTFAHTNPETF